MAKKGMRGRPMYFWPNEFSDFLTFWSYKLLGLFKIWHYNLFGDTLIEIKTLRFDTNF